MTLIVGIICSNGVVIGADSAATMGSLGTRTVIQPTKKLEIISDRVILGVSGPVGLGQRFAQELQTSYSAGEYSGKPPVDAMTAISDKFRPHMAKEYQAAQMAAPIIGNGLASTDTITTSVVGMVIGDKAELFQFDQQGAPERATQGLPFISIGSGQSIADPFLCFLRKIFWANVEPNLNDGILATLWTLQHAIDTNPGGVAGPIHIATLAKEPTGRGRATAWKAVELGQTDLQEHEEAVKAAEEALANFRTEITEEADAPEIPSPSDSTEG